MTVESLMAMGLSEEQAKQVMAGLDGDYVTKARFNEVNTQKNQAQQELATMKKQPPTPTPDAGGTEKKEPPASTETAALQQLEQLKAEREAEKAAHEKELLRLKVEAAAEKQLTKRGVLSITAAKAFLQLDDAELDADGTVKGLEEQLKALEKHEEAKILFPAAGGAGGKEGRKISGFEPAPKRDGTPTDTPPVTLHDAISEALNAQAQTDNTTK